MGKRAKNTKQLGDGTKPAGNHGNHELLQTKKMGRKTADKGKKGRVQRRSKKVVNSIHGNQNIQDTSLHVVHSATNTHLTTVDEDEDVDIDGMGGDDMDINSIGSDNQIPPDPHLTTQQVGYDPSFQHLGEGSVENDFDIGLGTGHVDGGKLLTQRGDSYNDALVPAAVDQYPDCGLMPNLVQLPQYNVMNGVSPCTTTPMTTIGGDVSSMMIPTSLVGATAATPAATTAFAQVTKIEQGADGRGYVLHLNIPALGLANVVLSTPGLSLAPGTDQKLLAAGANTVLPTLMNMAGPNLINPLGLGVPDLLDDTQASLGLMRPEDSLEDCHSLEDVDSGHDSSPQSYVSGAQDACTGSDLPIEDDEGQLVDMEQLALMEGSSSSSDSGCGLGGIDMIDDGYSSLPHTQTVPSLGSESIHGVLPRVDVAQWVDGQDVPTQVKQEETSQLPEDSSEYIEDSSDFVDNVAEYVDDPSEYVDNSQYVEDVGTAEYVENGSSTEYVDNRGATEYVECPSDFVENTLEYVDNCSATDYVENGSVTDYVENGPVTDYVDNCSVTDYVDSGTLTELVENPSAAEFVEVAQWEKPEVQKFVICSDGPMECVLCAFKTVDYSAFKSHIICSHPCWRITKKLSKNRLLVEKAVKMNVNLTPLNQANVKQRKNITAKDQESVKAEGGLSAGAKTKKGLHVYQRKKQILERNKRLFRCSLCMRLFVFEGSIVNHLVDHHMVKKPYDHIQVSNNHGVSFGRIHRCAHKNCYTSCVTEDELERHRIESHAQVVYRCQICGFTADTSETVEHHASSIHNQYDLMYGLVD